MLEGLESHYWKTEGKDIGLGATSTTGDFSCTAVLIAAKPMRVEKKNHVEFANSGLVC